MLEQDAIEIVKAPSESERGMMWGGKELIYRAQLAETVRGVDQIQEFDCVGDFCIQEFCTDEFCAK